MLATTLDPRHKHLGFLTTLMRIAAHAKLLEVLAEAEAGRGSSTLADAVSDQQEVVGAVPVQGAVLQRRSAYALLMGENYTTRSTDDVEKEVDSFLKDPPPLLDSSPAQHGGKSMKEGFQGWQTWHESTWPYQARQSLLSVYSQQLPNC